MPNGHVRAGALSSGLALHHKVAAYLLLWLGPAERLHVSLLLAEEQSLGATAGPSHTCRCIIPTPDKRNSLQYAYASEDGSLATTRQVVRLMRVTGLPWCAVCRNA